MLKFPSKSFGSKTFTIAFVGVLVCSMVFGLVQFGQIPQARADVTTPMNAVWFFE